MLSPRWRKILRDLWANKARTMLVVLSIAVGVFAVGTVAHMQYIVSENLVASYAAVNPAQVIIHTERGFDQEFINTIQDLPEVRAAEGRRSFVVKFKLDPEDDWHPMLVFAIPDYEAIQINKVMPEEIFEPDPLSWPEPNVWPPPDRALLLERTSLLMADLGLGTQAQQNDLLLVETPFGKQRQMPIAGLTYDFSRVPATFAGQAYGYVTFDTLEWLGMPRDLNELHLLLEGDPNNWAELKVQANEVADRVERTGYGVLRTEVPEPGKLPLDAQFRALTLILGVLGGFALFLAAFLVINTISALLTQQIRQIGVMKAVGARTEDIMQMYLSMVLVFGALSLFIAVPLALFIARHAISMMAYFINFKLGAFEIPPQVLGLQIFVGILVPVLAAIYPVLAGARITVREAISSYGLSDDAFGTSFIDRMMESIKGLPRPLLLSLRNTFRRKTRLGLTLITLILSGAIFIAVISVRSSLDATLEESFQYWQFDVQIQFPRPYRISRLEYETLRVPGVEAVESWGSLTTFRIRADGSESEPIYVTALPADTEMLQPVVVAGRWLEPGDENALVINNALWNAEHLNVGDEIILEIEDRETLWHVVGIAQTVTPVPYAYANYPYFAQVTRDVGMASSIQVTTSEKNTEYQEEVAGALETHFESVGIRTAGRFTTSMQRAQSAVLFNIIVTLLMIMAMLMAFVGGLGLMGTMSLNVLERTREIGVMRAVGASDGAVLQIFLVEGIFIGVISWALALVLGLPIGRLLSNAVGMQFFSVPLSYTFSVRGGLIWLALVVALSAVATYLPAQRAVALSVREVLAYE